MPDCSRNQRTIAHKLTLIGAGLHRKRASVSLHPAPPGFGIAFFYRNRLIPLSVETAEVKDHTVGCGGVWVIEHLLSALYGLEIDNVVVECATGELPFFDGSAAPFVNELQYNISEQSVPAIYCVVSNDITIGSRNTFISARPSKKLHLNLVMENRVLGEQRFDATVVPTIYMAEVAPARTFAIVRPDDPRLRHLPAYGIGITSQGVFSREPIRFDNEPIRHKALDLLGDLALAGGRIRGRLVGRNISHRLNHRLVKAITSARSGVRSPPSSPPHP